MKFVLGVFLGMFLSYVFWVISFSTLYYAQPEPPTLVPLAASSVGVQSTTFYATATGYSSTKDQTDSTPFITASGARVKRGTLAVSPDMLKKLPFGTRVEIAGQHYIIEDSMHPRWRNAVDIWFPSRMAAIRWGRRAVEMKILDIPKEEK